MMENNSWIKYSGQEELTLELSLDNITDAPNSMDTKHTTLENFVFYSEAVVEITIFSFGIIFNLINYIILRETKIADTFRICLLALTLTDTGTCIFAVAQLSVEAVSVRGVIKFGYWNRGVLASHLLYYIFALFACTSSVYVLLIGGMRTYMISKPHESVGKFKPKQVKLICWILFITVLVLFLPSPLYAMFQVCFAEDNIQSICVDYLQKVPHIQNMKYYFYILSILFIPCVVIGNCICFFKIKNALRKSKQRALRLNREEIICGRSRLSVTKTLLFILFLDTLWIMPYCIQYVTLAFYPQNTLFNFNNSLYVIFDIIVEILYSFRPTYNIFIYLYTNSEYRHTFMKKFCCGNVQKEVPKIVEKYCSDIVVNTYGGISCEGNIMSKATSFSTHISVDDNLKCSNEELSKLN